MHPIRKQRLQIISFSVAIRNSCGRSHHICAWAKCEFFLHTFPNKNDEYRKGSTLRVGGMVVEDSIKRFDETLAVEFTSTDGNAFIAVVFDGILPDLFAENEAAIATVLLKILES